MASSSIDKNSPVPLYYQLKNLLLEDIQSGKYPKGSLIPTELELGTTYQLSRTTVRQALTELVQEGWLTRQKGRGTFVTQTNIQQDFLNRIESFNDNILRSGMEPTTEVLDLRIVEATDDVAKNLQLEPGGKAIYLHRLRKADGEPIVSVETYLPYERCAFLLDHDLATEQLYSVLNLSPATAIHHIHRNIQAIEATRGDEKLLRLATGKPIQASESVGYSAEDVPIEYSLARYRGDRNTFQVMILPYLHP